MKKAPKSDGLFTGKYAVLAVWNNRWRPRGWHEVIDGLDYAAAERVAKSVLKMGAESCSVHKTASARKMADMANKKVDMEERPWEYAD